MAKLLQPALDKLRRLRVVLSDQDSQRPAILG
jgi:hypothetical protein